MEALAASCTQLAAAWDRRAAYNVACDVLVASLLLLLHGATLMSQVGGGGGLLGEAHLPCARSGTGVLPARLLHSHPLPLRPPPQAMVFGVAMNSKKNTLVALLIAANFTEIKGKRRWRGHAVCCDVDHLCWQGDRLPACVWCALCLPA